MRDLLALANSFVAFSDFYTQQGKATFQIGTLYLDGRSAEPCVAVNDAANKAFPVKGKLAESALDAGIFTAIGTAPAMVPAGFKLRTRAVPMSTISASRRKSA